MLFIMLEGDVVTEVEKRRLKLLQDVRKNYNDKDSPPAIHPRYRMTYQSLYGEEVNEEPAFKASFMLRLFLAALLFACFIFMDYSKEELLNVSSQTIINEVQKNLFSQ